MGAASFDPPCAPKRTALLHTFHMLCGGAPLAVILPIALIAHDQASRDRRFPVLFSALNVQGLPPLLA
jgi:hypothetical protein